MKNLITVLFLVFMTATTTYSQVYTASSSNIRFFSEAALENIEAHTTKSSSLLNTKTGQVVFQIPIAAFEFEKNLMKEHFNENYLESEKYPKASFSGNLNETIDFATDGKYKASVTGKLNIHGVEKDRTIHGEITVKEGKISLKAEFVVKLVDHKVKIPKVVIKNIAEEVLVSLEADYQPYAKKK